jgi:hypothetical protein
MWEPQPLTTLWASTASYRDSFTLALPSFKPLYTLLNFNIQRVASVLLFKHLLIVIIIKLLQRLWTQNNLAAVIVSVDCISLRDIGGPHGVDHQDCYVVECYSIIYSLVEVY